MDAVAAVGENYGTPIILNCNISIYGDPASASLVANRFASGMYYVADSFFGTVMLATLGSGWFAMFDDGSTTESTTEA